MHLPTQLSLYYPHYPLCDTESASRTMGTGLLQCQWTTHVKALQAKWILNYLNTRKAIWKHALELDAWFCRTGLGRGAVLSTVPMKTLTRSIRGNPALPAFWKDALATFRSLETNSPLTTHTRRSTITTSVAQSPRTSADHACGVDQPMGIPADACRA